MHWFDEISRQAAESPEGSTRRSVLKGATAAMLSLPFLPGAIEQASAAGTAGQVPQRSTPLRRESTSEFCSNCLNRSYADRNQQLKACGSGGAKRAARPKGTTKAGKKTTPARAAKQAACQARVMKELNKELQGCRQHFCEGDSEPPAPSPVTGGESGCPSGTTRCSAELCCYGGDACCVCGSTGGFICCAAVVGCGCC
jgi:hypothetical protein